MPSVLTFQEVLLSLSHYWTAQGAVLAQPFNTEVGAGTANPATTLRVLGPEPWRVAYVEPSVRPDDSRYGDNPNRLQTHTQFQVILKPDPGNPQELYLGSLEAIGIDLEAHDIRFVEDNWTSPALGAWGLGWEVWLDGMEITQFTYFQQSGSTTLDPVSVEITYGIERIVMALQGVSHFKDIAYAPGITYGEVFAQSEYEMSRYYLDEADIEMQRSVYAMQADEAQRMIEARLPVPAHYAVLKCSHAFNVLDSRGAVSTAERARAFGLMRSLSKSVATLWVERRQELGLPLGTVEPPPAPTPLPMPDAPAQAATLLFEIGLEELPAAEVTRARNWVQDALTTALAGTRLGHGAITTYATPRRLVAVVADVAPAEPSAEQTVRGPRESAAFDADGNPTKAAEGFARKQGVDPRALDRIEVDGVTYVGLTRTVEGRTAPVVLSEALGALVTGLRADRNMRWNDPALSYVRPVRWLLALLGDAPVPVTASALTSGTTTRVLRTAAQPEIPVERAEGYLDLLRAHGIVADAGERRATVLAAAQERAAAVGGVVDLDLDGDVVDEIVNLVEAPVPVVGGYETRFLELPPEVLISVMRKHQRYLPVRDASGALLPHFVTFANGACDEATVAAGNEAVIRARFEDASFFWNADRTVSPQQFKDGLDKLAFEPTLGSMADRSARIAATARALADAAGLDAPDRATLDRAAALAKFDLASQMVIEMTSLAGTMAGYYARSGGEPDAVATALVEMERPHTSEDDPAETLPGALLALADRADLLVGLFAVGARPTGSSDPYALRRAALGVVATLQKFPALSTLTVARILGLARDAVAAQGVAMPDDVLEAVGQFVARRFQQSLLDDGHPVDLVNAVLPLADDPAFATATLQQVLGASADPDFAALTQAVQRVRRLIGDAEAPEPRAEELGEHEQALAAALADARQALGDRRAVADLLDATRTLVSAVNTFLDAVQVMADDPQVRAARIGLLRQVADLVARPGIDWDALPRTT